VAVPAPTIFVKTAGLLLPLRFLFHGLLTLESGVNIAISGRAHKYRVRG
jgi:hypothetical protein